MLTNTPRVSMSMKTRDRLRRIAKKQKTTIVKLIDRVVSAGVKALGL